MKAITIVANDKVGLLADISYILAKAKINIQSVTVDVMGDKAIVTLGLSDIVNGKSVLENAGYKIEEMNEGISIQNAQTLSKDDNYTILSLIVDKPKRALVLLKENLIGTES